MKASAVPKRLQELGAGAYAYLQHDGSWGWSNSGMVVGGRQALMVDTLFDLSLTRELLEAYGRVLPAGGRITTLVNSHANGDHTFGNQLVQGARIVASQETAAEMAETPPERLAGLMRLAPQAGLVGEFLERIFGTFDFEGITLTLPDETFAGELSLQVGDTEVRLLELGPAHTRGDTIVLVPSARLVYTADLVFVGGHPIIWQGPLENWLRALELILGLEVDTVVPGHGPVTDKQGVRQLKDYFLHLDREARPRFEAGLSPMQAALDIPMAEYATWGEAERIVVNLAALYRGYAGTERPGLPQHLAEMAEFDRIRRNA